MKNKSKDFPAKIFSLYFSWCTNLNVNDGNRASVATKYPRGWNIEHFYRGGKGNFLVKTKTKIFKVRLFFFLPASLYNLWQLVKLILGEDLTAQKWKYSVYELLYARANICYTTAYEQKI